MSKLTGVIPPVCTPLTTDREVDVESYKRLLDFLIEGGVDGLFILGSSSEVVYLTDAQRRTVIETAMTHVAGRVPVLAGVIDTTTPRVLEHVRVATELGVDGIVVTAPFYTRTHPIEIERHFRAIHEATPVPLWAYDIPVCVNVKLSRELVLRLAADGVIVGLKDSSGDDGNLRYLIRDIAGDARFDDFSVLTGSELLVDTGLWFGVDGVVPGLGNVDPAGYARLFAHTRAGEWEKARLEQDRLLNLFELVNVGPDDRMGRNSSAIGAFKAGLYLRGVIETPLTAMPQVPLNDEEIGAVRGYLVGAGLL
jgi:4-hydroxy-tetrahydrodipicolinate synthase